MSDDINIEKIATEDQYDQNKNKVQNDNNLDIVSIDLKSSIKDMVLHLLYSQKYNFNETLDELKPSNDAKESNEDIN